MKIVLPDSATLGDDLDLSPLSKYGEVVAYPSTDISLVEERLSDADVVIVNKVKLNQSTIGENCPVKLICIAATGFDNVDLDYMKKKGIGVCNVVGYSTDSVAQLTVSMVLSLATHLPEYCAFVESGEYSRGNVANKLTPVYHEIAGKTWGVVGLGNIGKKVAAVAGAFGCRVIANKRTPVEGYGCVDIDTLCREADIITVHTPLNDGTRNLINEERIAMMKNDAIFVNVARGAVCDEAALCKAVKEGKIGAIGVDVYSQEPFREDSPYFDVKDLPNVCLTPHMAWGSYEARNRCLSDIMASIDAFLSGEKRSRLV
ncbi:MAG: hydroxyacid dehydrogenase [Ruminococcaceae bacterium]|nr:hydroxyacid dehydrogenase [Oscillospiraceae bacterium]